MTAVSTNTIATIAYAKQILADIDDSSMCQQPMGLNHPAWLLLHLATAADYAASLLGGKGICPADWNALADTKKPQTQTRSDYPAKEELLTTFEAAFRNASFLKKLNAQDLVAKLEKVWLDGVEKALTNNKVTLTALSITRLIAANGYLDKLRARGFVVEEPTED